METQLIQKYIDSHKNKLTAIYSRDAYSIGKHPAINSAPAKSSPDYRISIPLIKSAIDQVAGYMARPGNITYIGEVYDTTLKEIYDDNEETLVTQQAFKTSCVQGEAWEVHWFEDGKPMFALIPTAQAIPVWTNTLKPKLEALIWWRKIDDEDIATVYDTNFVTTYNVSKSYSLISEEPHGYGQVPSIRFRIDMSGRNLFDHVLPLCDALDRIYSHDVANEAKKFADAYLLLRDRLNQEDRDALKETATFEGLGDNVNTAVSFLTKQIPVDFLTFASKNLHDMTYETLQIPNPDSQSDTPSSGFAMVVKNMNFENLCASIEGAFIRGLQDRIRLICGHSLINEDGTEISVKMYRNMPYDLESTAKVIAQLSGTLDIEAQLNLLPSSVLSDEDKKRIIAQKIADKEATSLLFGSAQDDQQEDTQEQVE